MMPQPQPSTLTNGEKALEVEDYTETYKVIAEWIRFADAKAGVTLTVNGILLGLLISTLKTYLDEKELHPPGALRTTVIVLFLAWLLFMVLSAVIAFLCILPIRGTARKLALKHTPHFHPMAICRATARRGGPLRRRLPAGRHGRSQAQDMTAILIDSHLSSMEIRPRPACHPHARRQHRPRLPLPAGHPALELRGRHLDQRAAAGHRPAAKAGKIRIVRSRISAGPSARAEPRIFSAVAGRTGKAVTSRKGARGPAWME